MQLSSGVKDNRNEHPEDLHNDGNIKLSSDLDPYGEEEQDQEWNKKRFLAREVTIKIYHHYED